MKKNKKMILLVTLIGTIYLLAKLVSLFKNNNNNNNKVIVPATQDNWVEYPMTTII